MGIVTRSLKLSGDTIETVIITDIISGETTLGTSDDKLVTERAIKYYVDNSGGGSGVESLSTALSSEIVTRGSADTSLSSAISTESSTRTSADTSLSSAISTGNSNITSLSTAVSTEISVRGSADTSLSTAISTTNSDISTNYVTLGTSQTITGTKTFSSNITFSGGTNKIISIADDTTARTLTIRSNNNSTSNGGILELRGGNSDYIGGIINIEGGSGYNDVGGSVNITGGYSYFNSGGNVIIRAGESENLSPGNIYIGDLTTSAIYLGNSVSIQTGTPGADQILYVDTADGYKLKRGTVSSGGVSYVGGTDVDNRVLTATGANTINGESNLTFNGSTLTATATIANVKDAYTDLSTYHTEYFSTDQGAGAFFIGLRFHHAGRFWHQLRTNVDGFHLTTGDSLTYTRLYAGITNITGSLTATSTIQSNVSFNISTAAGTGARTDYFSSGQLRWSVGKDSSSETGSNVGGNFAFYRYTDAGSYLGQPLFIWRDTGKVEVNTDGASDLSFFVKNANATGYGIYSEVQSASRYVFAGSLAGTQKMWIWGDGKIETLGGLKIDIANAAAGKVWTATDADGNGDWATPAGGSSFLSGLTDVTFSGSPASGQTLTYSGGSWTNVSPIDLSSNLAEGQFIFLSGQTLTGTTWVRKDGKALILGADDATTSTGNNVFISAGAGSSLGGSVEIKSGNGYAGATAGSIYIYSHLSSTRGIIYLGYNSGITDQGKVNISDKAIVGSGVTTATLSTFNHKTLNVIFSNSNTTITTGLGGQSDGGLLIRNTSSTNGTYANLDFLAVGASSTTHNTARICFVGSSSYGETTNYLSYVLYNGSSTLEQFRMTRSGVFHAESDVIGYSTTISSDIRLKKDIEDVKDDSLSKLLSLRPVNFNWINKENKYKTTGFIAQELENIFPELIFETNKLNDETGTMYKHIRYNELIPHIIHSVQQQQNIIKEQKLEIDELKKEINILKNNLK